MKLRQNKMLNYLAMTAGAGCVSTAANAAVVFYGNAANHNLQADPIGVNIGHVDGKFEDYWLANTDGTMRFAIALDGMIWTRGSNLVANSNTHGHYWSDTSGALNGAVSGMDNYANVSFDGDAIYEAVAQFYFDGAGGGYLMAIATTNPIPNPQNLSAVGGPALSISAGKAMIDAAAVPEPTSLGLFALGAMGLATRRQRRKAA